MGGVFGHMSHIYDNPNMTFGQIKDIMTKASAGQLENVTEKTDGQNLFVSYKLSDGTQRWVPEEAVRSARNKGDIKNGGMTPEQLATKFAGRGALEDAFTNAFRAFAKTVDKFSEEEKLKLFGPDTNIYYNAEVMDPANANVINYDTKTFLIHRAGHAEYDKETGKPVDKEQGFSEQQASTLQNVLEKSQDEMSKGDFRVQVNAIRQLKALGDDVALSAALKGMDQVMSSAGVSDDDTIGDYIIGKWRQVVNKELPDLSDEGKQLIIKRVMTDYYGALEGEGPLKSRGLETRQITKTIGQPELNKQIVSVIKSYPQRFKEFIFPVESVIHRFAIEIMRAVQSAYIIAAGGNEKEVARLQALVGKAIETIQASGNEEAMEILRPQLEKLSKIEDDGSIGDVDLSMISSAAEGIVFDYDGHTYKFTGGFAPANQILGLFKYGRKGIPAMAGEEDLEEGLWDSIKKFAKEGGWPKKPTAFKKKISGMVGDTFSSSLAEGAGNQIVVVYPGRFQPMGRHHAATYEALTQKFGADNVFVATSNVVKPPKSPLNFEQKKDIMVKHGIPEGQIVQTKNPYQAQELLTKFDPATTSVVFAVGKKDMQESPRFANLGGTRKDGKPAYLRRLGDDEELAKFSKHGYVDIAPHVSLDVPGVGEMSGTALRQALAGADPETFQKIMGFFDQEIYDMLRNTLQEISSVSGGASSGFADRAPKVVGSEREKYRHPKDFIAEVSAMIAGDIEGGMIGTGSKKGPWHNLDVEAENEKQKEISKLKGDKEELVSEVVDYLLGITVG